MPGEILLIDNYDSFTHNLFHLVERNTSQKIRVVSNDSPSLVSLVESTDSVIISPGPGLPANAGNLFEIMPLLLQKQKVLGVCLGHQAIASFFGATLYNSDKVYHGVKMKLLVEQPADDLFNHLPESYYVGRYHSWLVNKKNLPEKIQVTATDENGCIMAFRIKNSQIRGIQFHPESLLSEYSDELITNWLNT